MPKEVFSQPKKLLLSEAGLTLLELMMIAAIVGILSALAVTQYETYQRKAIRAEAKLALSAIYSLEKAFYSEYSAYVPSLDAIGYAPETSRRFYKVGWGNPSNFASSITGYSGGFGNKYWLLDRSPAR